MPGDQQRDQMIAQLLIGERRTLLVARRDQQCEHVLASLWVGAVSGDLLVEQPIDLRQDPQCGEAPHEGLLEELGICPGASHLQQAHPC